MSTVRFSLDRPDVRMVKLDEVFIGERMRKDMGDVQELAQDIRENGLYHPPTVRPPTDVEDEFVSKQYILVAGGRRLGALALLGLTEIPVLLKEVDELQGRIIELNENLKRKDMTWQEQDLARQEILQLRTAQAQLEGKKITQADVAIEIGMSPAGFSRSITAAEAIQKNPKLKGAASRKSAMRAHEMEQHHKRLTLREALDGQAKDQAQFLQTQVVAGDSRDWIRKIPMASVDLVLTDPPYGINYFKSGHKMRAGGKHTSLGIAQYNDSADAAMDFLVDMVPQWTRILRETGWLACFASVESYDFLFDLVSDCCAEHFAYRYQPTPDELTRLHDREIAALRRQCVSSVEDGSVHVCRFLRPHPVPWIWYRPNSRNRPRYPERHAQNQYEKILICNMGKARLTAPTGNVLVHDAVYGEDRIHPNQKPVSLGTHLTKLLSQMEDTVVDTSYGSGGLLAGAAASARFVKGCELNEDMWGPALGLIMKNILPTSNQGKQRSEERYQRQLREPAIGVDEYEEFDPDEN